MKLTKSQLQKLIKEELDEIHAGHGMGSGDPRFMRELNKPESVLAGQTIQTSGEDYETQEGDLIVTEEYLKSIESGSERRRDELTELQDQVREIAKRMTDQQASDDLLNLLPEDVDFS